MHSITEATRLAPPSRLLRCRWLFSEKRDGKLETDGPRLEQRSSSSTTCGDVRGQPFLNSVIVAPDPQVEARVREIAARASLA